MHGLAAFSRVTRSCGVCIHRCSTVLAHLMLGEKLHPLGMLGCALCIVGSVVIVLHAPHEQPIHSVQHLWQLAMRPGAPAHAQRVLSQGFGRVAVDNSGCGVWLSMRVHDVCYRPRLQEFPYCGGQVRSLIWASILFRSTLGALTCVVQS